MLDLNDVAIRQALLRKFERQRTSCGAKRSQHVCPWLNKSGEMGRGRLLYLCCRRRDQWRQIQFVHRSLEKSVGAKVAKRLVTMGLIRRLVRGWQTIHEEGANGWSK